MIPQIITVGPLPVNSFGLMVALAIVVGIHLLQKSFGRSGIPVEFAERYVLTAAVVGLLSARLWHIGENWADLKHDLFSALTSGAGFTFYGGFLVSFIVILVMAKRDRIPVATLFDALGPTLALAYAVGRLGCQLSGDGDYGMGTHSWLGMSYATGVVPTPPGVLVYPTPFFESLGSLVILFILLAVEKKEWFIERPFSRAGLYLLLISFERFMVEFLRINPRFAWNLSEAQWIAMALAFVGLCFMRWGNANRNSVLRFA